MNTKLLQKQAARDFDSAYERDFDDLVWERRAGHMGHHEYVDSSMHLWAEFIDENRGLYYIPDAEIDLIERAAGASATLVGGGPVTLVSRGCGTKFLAKEGRLIQDFKNVVGVVYLDRADAALEQSIAEGRALLPNAWHKAINCDLYDPALRYPVDGTEVSAMFGMTLANIEGFPTASSPKEAYVRNLEAVYSQMRPGAHFITTFDHNQDKKSVEQAYAGQTKFAKDMLQRTGSIDPDSVNFVVKFHPKSEILAHGFQFREDTVVTSRSGVMPFRAGKTLWFNNSAKLSVDSVCSWNREAGFDYARSDVATESRGYLGWHHLIK